MVGSGSLLPRVAYVHASYLDILLGFTTVDPSRFRVFYVLYRDGASNSFSLSAMIVKRLYKEWQQNRSSLLMEVAIVNSSTES